MVKIFTVVFATVLSLHAANCYVLITADLDDVHAIAQQIAQSPVSRQLATVIRRASEMFNRHLFEQRTRRREDVVDGREKQDHRVRPSNEKNSSDNIKKRADGSDDVVALGKNASAYLSSMKQFFENIGQ